MRSLAITLGMTAMLGLSACGHSTGERLVSGAGIGALGGAGIAAATHGDPLTGALIGGGLGLAAGAIVDSDHRHSRRHYGRSDYDRPYYGRRGRYYR